MRGWGLVDLQYSSDRQGSPVIGGVVHFETVTTHYRITCNVPCPVLSQNGQFLQLRDFRRRDGHDRSPRRRPSDSDCRLLVRSLFSRTLTDSALPSVAHRGWLSSSRGAPRESQAPHGLPLFRNAIIPAGILYPGPIHPTQNLSLAHAASLSTMSSYPPLHAVPRFSPSRADRFSVD